MTTGPPWCPPGLAQNSIMLLGRALVLMNSSASWRPWMEGERPLGGSWGGTQNVGGGRDGNKEWIYDSAPAGSWDEQEKPKGTFQLNIAKFRSWVIAETGTNETLIWGTGFFFSELEQTINRTFSQLLLRRHSGAALVLLKCSNFFF